MIYARKFKMHVHLHMHDNVLDLLTWEPCLAGNYTTNPGYRWLVEQQVGHSLSS